ncbi:MAG: hypothetical protein UR28_C0028G0004 [Candidatus Peregrinibacteria bacterium GW2011_GWF2_33_10]|nr:MAG: hypothetical protein UR28_C0028G0004 [Candidatus Peregrinibacteria bacterium GW2011_GWF2_33_10]OGJ44398.1 MAG: hypothetical protein A2272_05615 [Candidatus Peregrinibacteria bacterium RIFOXYA12_FULL_33_12]OGJ45867.1 MAG: hypothetical protein A2263_03695 [Candidatus Peregrinibacteria bacterium RIFOXYA2_FULL_33_21]OGJ51341.1 MAG: hypothetical protein A2307_02200 [Candidatus Peregrinibacteria bacterium RIFOXYB2_FULL_33_20]
MEVLFPGTKKPSTIDVKCSGNGSGSNGCGSTLRINENDIFIAGSGMDSTGDEPCIKCPECKAITIIQNEQQLTRVAWQKWSDKSRQ